MKALLLVASITPGMYALLVVWLSGPLISWLLACHAERLVASVGVLLVKSGTPQWPQEPGEVDSLGQLLSWPFLPWYGHEKTRVRTLYTSTPICACVCVCM